MSVSFLDIGLGRGKKTDQPQNCPVQTDRIDCNRLELTPCPPKPSFQWITRQPKERNAWWCPSGLWRQLCHSGAAGFWSRRLSWPRRLLLPFSQFTCFGIAPRDSWNLDAQGEVAKL